MVPPEWKLSLPYPAEGIEYGGGGRGLVTEMFAKPTLGCRGDFRRALASNRCLTGSKLVRPGDNLGWSFRRPPLGHISGFDRAS